MHINQYGHYSMAHYICIFVGKCHLDMEMVIDMVGMSLISYNYNHWELICLAWTECQVNVLPFLPLLLSQARAIVLCGPAPGTLELTWFRV